MLPRIGPLSDQSRSAGVNRQTKARTRSSLANRVTVCAVAATVWSVGETICCSFIAIFPGVRDLLARAAGNHPMCHSRRDACRDRLCVPVRQDGTARRYISACVCVRVERRAATDANQTRAAYRRGRSRTRGEAPTPAPTLDYRDECYGSSPSTAPNMPPAQAHDELA